MPKLKLSYFDFDGGRGESIRLALAIGNIPFEDHRFPVRQWPEYSDRMPLRQVPVMKVDGETITQSNTLNRYVGKLAGIYPDDALEAAHCDEVMDALEDIQSKIVDTFFIQDEEEKRQAREALAAGPISLYLGWLEDKLKSRGGKFFAGNRLSVADLKVYIWVRALGSGKLDYLPTDIVERVAPMLREHFQRVDAQPEIVAYYQRRALEKTENH